MKSPKKFPLSWMFKMAWRDGHRSWKRLLLYVSATSVGIAALVAAGSLQFNIEEAIRRQAKPLVGADLVVRDRRPFDEKAIEMFSAIPHPRLREIELTTVAYFPSTQSGRLLEIRAVEQGFPFYGEVKTDPPQALSAIFNEPRVLLEENVMREFNLRVGDAVDLGRTRFNIAGILKIAPGEAMASVFSAPQAFIALPFLQNTGLIQETSLARHKIYFRIEDEKELKKIEALVDPKTLGKQWRLSTVAERQRTLGQRAENVSRFLKIAALVALLLGGIGVASILFVYARDKRPMVATLKCVGAPALSTLGIFIVQGVSLGAMGTLLGSVLGLALQAALPSMLRSFILIDLPASVSWPPLFNGALVGFSVTLIFSILPLLGLRTVSPLAALRINIEPFSGKIRNKPAAWLLSHVPARWPYPWRQGLANLFRPNNQTHILVPALGLGAALIFAISFLNNSLLSHLSISTSQQEPSLAMIDIQPDQRAGVRRAMQQEKVTIVEEASFVSMRIEQIKGQPIQDIENKKSGRPEWVLRHDYRSSYRNHMGTSEKIVVGKWPPPTIDVEGAVPISLEQGIAEDLGVGLGDEITFNVQGLSMKTVVSALRRVDWFQLRPNFFVIFPEGVLEEAPQFSVMLVKTTSVQETAAIQKKLRQEFPNVSTVDLRMVLETLNNYFNKVALVLKFMAMFVVVTGLMILAGALISGRYERLREAALLRTLGASANTIRFIHLVEYALMGLTSGLFGLFIGGGGSLLMTKYIFKIGFNPGIYTPVAGLAAMMLINGATGLFLGRGILSRHPLQNLREDEG